ncbi:hypothetical protein P9112_005918 [Eukaryota sp. TZLM1-RC]
MYDNDFYNNLCSSTVLDQDPHSLLLENGLCENQSSDSSLLITIVPRRFGLFSKPFATKMRLYLNIPIDQLQLKETCICSDSPQLTLRHALNCSKLIPFRSSLHDAVRDTVFNRASNARISCIKERFLRETLSLNCFGSDDRGAIYCDWIVHSPQLIDSFGFSIELEKL